MAISLPQGVVHTIPADVRKVLTTNATARTVWLDITPLARNEWLCWIEEAKKAETRAGRIKKMQSMFRAGKRRPCCWQGCSHR